MVAPQSGNRFSSKKAGGKHPHGEANWISGARDNDLHCGDNEVTDSRYMPNPFWCSVALISVNFLCWVQFNKEFVFVSKWHNWHRSPLSLGHDFVAMPFALFAFVNGQEGRTSNAVTNKRKMRRMALASAKGISTKWKPRICSGSLLGVVGHTGFCLFCSIQ